MGQTVRLTTARLTTARLTTARLILDPPAPGTWNMAVDEALLRTATASNQLTLRFYQWSEPTLSLGYFQRAADRNCHPASTTCPVVRRATGGGAILHDRELTYSLVVPRPNRHPRSPTGWYQVVHQALIETLASFAVPAFLCAETDPAGEDRFLCFQRRARGDVLLSDTETAVSQHASNAPGAPVSEALGMDQLPTPARNTASRSTFKIAGSAQRRRRDALLQHGSLLLVSSPFAPELKGIAQSSKNTIDVAQLIAQWSERLAFDLGLQWQTGKAEQAELDQAAWLETNQFGAAKWTLKR